jgi:hypothetical protein
MESGKVKINYRLERRIRIASLLTGGGLLIQILTLLRVHPLAFLVFLGVGCPLMAAGVVLFLFSLLSANE